MTRSDIIGKLADNLPILSKADAETAVLTILDAFKDSLLDGKRIEIRDFGSFSVKTRSPRIGRNPRNGENVAVKATHVVHFKPGKALRDGVKFSGESQMQKSEIRGLESHGEM